MPNVTIKEIDNTTNSSPELNSRVVMIQGLSAKAGATVGTEFECKTLAELQANVCELDSEGEVVTEPTGIGYEIAKRLLKLGLEILYVVITSVSDISHWGEKDTSQSEVNPFYWEKYTDKSLYNIRFIVNGTGVPTDTINDYMLSCAAARGDAIALCDIADSDSVTTIQTSLAAITGSKYVGDEDPRKYGACFTSTFTVEGKNTSFPGSFAYLACFAEHTSRFADWFAFAGSTRGVLPYTKVKPTKEFGDAKINKLQPRTSTGAEGVSSCNVIANIRPYDYIIWGNRTLFPVKSEGLLASHFLNIRNLCCDIKKKLYATARKYTFEPNSDVLWINFCSDITPLLEEMKSGQGIRGYEIIKEATTERATLKARIRIIPIEAVEDFDLTVELTDSIEITE